MKCFGVTGGIGMGKSVAGTLLRERGVKVLDSDVISREQTQPGTPAMAEIASAFGEEVFDPDGNLNRPRLAEIVFSDPSARSELERILHPRIEAAWRGQLGAWQTEGVRVAGVLIPLLFECRYEASFTAVVTVACTAGAQRLRLRKRGWDDAQIDARLAAQLPIEDKMQRARFVVWTEGSLACHGRQWDRLLASV